MASYSIAPGTLVHDLRTPLATLTVNLGFVLEALGASVPEDVREALQDCVTASRRVEHIVAGMATRVAERAIPSGPPPRR